MQKWLPLNQLLTNTRVLKPGLVKLSRCQKLLVAVEYATPFATKLCHCMGAYTLASRIDYAIDYQIDSAIDYQIDCKFDSLINSPHERPY